MKNIGKEKIFEFIQIDMIVLAAGGVEIIALVSQSIGPGLGSRCGERHTKIDLPKWNIIETT